MNQLQSDLLFLLSGVLWKKEIPVKRLTQIDWEAMYTIAKEQCVVGLVADSFTILHEQECNGLDKLKWLGFIVRLEQKNRKLNNLVGKLFLKFNIMGLSPILMKGQAFAVNYFYPLRRQCGDIDICFRRRDDTNLAVAWAKKVDIVAANSSDNKRERKHFTFSVEGSVVELHYFMCLFENEGLQHRLQEIIDWEFTHSSPFYVDIDGKQIETVPPSLSVLHQVLHITRHLLEAGIGLRQICDLAVYLEKNHDKINSCRLNGYLEELQLMTTAKTLGFVMMKWLGLKEEFVPFGVDERYAEFILQEVFEGGNFGKKKVVYRSDKNGLRRKLSSIAYFYRRCQLYKPLLPKESRSYFRNKIKLNIKLLFASHY